MSELEAAAHTASEMTGPRVLHEGRYRLYEKPDGTLRIQYRRDDKEEDDYMEIPGGIIRLAKLASEGKLPNPMKMMQVFRTGDFSGVELYLPGNARPHHRGGG